MRSRSSTFTRPFSGSIPTAPRLSRSSGMSRPTVISSAAPSAVEPSDSSTTCRPPLARTGADGHRPGVEAHVHAVAMERLGQEVGAARMLPVVDAVARVDDGDRHAVAGVHLPQLHAARPAAQHHHPVRQLAQRGALAVGPVPGLLQPRQGRDAGVRAHGQHHAAGLQRPRRAGRIADFNPEWIGPGEASLAPDRLRAGLGQCLHVARVVRIVPIDAIDHVVAKGRCLRPRVLAATVMDRGGMQQRLGWHALPERTAAAEQVALDDRHRGATLAALVGRGLARGPGADDDQVVSVHAREE